MDLRLQVHSGDLVGGDWYSQYTPRDEHIAWYVDEGWSLGDAQKKDHHKYVYIYIYMYRYVCFLIFIPL